MSFAYLQPVELENFIGVPVKSLSSGNEARVNVAAEFNPSQSTVIPRYALVYQPTAEYLYISGVRYDEESGQIVVVRETPDDIVLAVVFDHARPGEWPEHLYRYVALVKKNENAPEAYDMAEWRRAPAVIEITDENGNKHHVVMGIGVLAAIIILAAIGVAGIAAVAFYKHADAEQKMADAVRKAVDYAVKNNRPDLVQAVFAGAAVVKHESESGGDLLGGAKRLVLEIGAPIVALMVLIFKWRVILDFFRDLIERFRERRRE